MMDALVRLLLCRHSISNILPCLASKSKQPAGSAVSSRQRASLGIGSVSEILTIKYFVQASSSMNEFGIRASNKTRVRHVLLNCSLRVFSLIVSCIIGIACKMRGACVENRKHHQGYRV